MEKIKIMNNEEKLKRKEDEAINVILNFIAFITILITTILHIFFNILFGITYFTMATKNEMSLNAFLLFTGMSIIWIFLTGSSFYELNKNIKDQ